MARLSRKLKGEKTKPILFELDQEINKLERAVIYRTVTSNFTLEDIVEWLWPKEILDILKVAFPYAPDRYRHSEGVKVPLRHGMEHCFFQISLTDVQVMRPKDDLMEIQSDTPLVATLQQAYDIYTKFQEVRTVISWFNQYATIGTARFYLPSLGALLPAEHAFHKATGIFRKPKRPISEIRLALLEAGRVTVQP